MSPFKICTILGTFTSNGTFEMLFSVCMSKLKQYYRKTQESKS